MNEDVSDSLEASEVLCIRNKDDRMKMNGLSDSWVM
jgi:hypothetical protein